MITKAEWEEIEDDLSRGYVDVDFTYKGFELAVSRVWVSESKTALVVYINGRINHGWGTAHIDFVKASEEFKSLVPSILADVWKARTKSLYTAKEIKEQEKIWGKRECKRMGIYRKFHYYEPYFSKASVLVRQFKKLDGLELASVG
ncbi:hypothetical protein ACWU37_16620 [Photobacterium damselae subsp. damselae]